MNIVLSCYAVKGKGVYTIEKGGKIVAKSVFGINKCGATLKEYIFECLIRGLRDVRNLVEHEDLLLVNLTNRHICEWLNESVEYKDYNEYLDVIYDIIDTIDCKYLFGMNKYNTAKSFINDSIDKEELQGISDIVNM